jgi:acetyl esterase
MPLTTQAENLLAIVYRVGAPRFHELSVEQARRSFSKLQYAFRADMPAVASIVDVPMSGRGRTPVLGRLYRPLDGSALEVLPLLVYLHGGGWCVGDIEAYDVLCRELCNAGRCAVLSVDYRLAPEHPFPCAVEDAGFAWRWALAHAEALRIDPRRVALAGDSAGGNLAIVTALALRDAGMPQPRRLVLLYPCTEIRSARPSRARFGEGYLLDRESLEWFFAQYLPEGGADDWRASPMRAASLAGLPGMLLVTAEYDPLVDDCVAFAHRVREEGGSVEHIAVSGLIHGFLTLGKMFPEVATTVERIGLTLQAAFAQAHP